MRTYVFDLVVSGLDLEDGAQIDHLWSGRIGVTPASRDGVTTVNVDLNAASEVAAVEAVMAHMATVPGVAVERIDLDLVTTTEIGARLGVDRETVRQWATRPANADSGFPPHFAIIPGGSKPMRVWRWATVHAWAALFRRDLIPSDLPEPLPPALVDRFNGRVPVGGYRPGGGGLASSLWSWPIETQVSVEKVDV